MSRARGFRDCHHTFSVHIYVSNACFSTVPCAENSTSPFLPRKHTGAIWCTRQTRTAWKIRYAKEDGHWRATFGKLCSTATNFARLISIISWITRTSTSTDSNTGSAKSIQWLEDSCWGQVQQYSANSPGNTIFCFLSFVFYLLGLYVRKLRDQEKSSCRNRGPQWDPKRNSSTTAAVIATGLTCGYRASFTPRTLRCLVEYPSPRRGARGTVHTTLVGRTKLGRPAAAGPNDVQKRPAERSSYIWTFSACERLKPLLHGSGLAAWSEVDPRQRRRLCFTCTNPTMKILDV